jgi:hypothetical protein
MSARIDDLPACQLRELLEADTEQLSFEEWLAREDFIQRIGGWGNAHMAVELLETMEE